MSAVFLHQVTATDPSKLASETTSLRYSVAGHYVREQPDAFSIESDGKVYLRKSLDRDYPYGHANWQINIVATDATMNGGKAGYGVVNLRLVDKNDNAPLFDTCCLSGTVAEHSPSGKKRRTLKNLFFVLSHVIIILVAVALAALFSLSDSIVHYCIVN